MPPAVRGLGRALTRLTVALALTAGLFATSSVVTTHEGGADSASAMTAHRRTVLRHKVKRGVHIAVNQKGDPYQYGSAGPNRFDCSGLMYYAFRKAGFSNMPRTSSEQARFTDRIKRSNMKRGDLIFFYNSSGVYHVGIFAGWSNGRRLVLHSPNSNGHVRTQRMWTNKWYGGTLRRR
ncbi:C40 family peptidase [Nocardioides sp. GY 10127]|uniref:C40 family peptidase n=1 Tax=Nocardioides sp. GY 10127 TaxID=2569762 RepID=UPI00145812CD|nr:C40 family peptidase [Nocardioides sp. GY 10127]